MGVYGTSEGKNIPFATDNGKIEHDRKYPTNDELDKTSILSHPFF